MFYIIIVIFFACVNYECVFANESVQNKIPPKKFVIVTASYNNIDYVSKNLESIFSQKCDENQFTFRMIYYDDCSEDGTGEFVEEYKKKFNLGNKLSLIRNSVKVGAHENIFHAIHSCDDKEIILIVDGDDWLARNDVLEILYEIYSNPGVWITYGQLKRYPSGIVGTCHEIPKDVIKSNSFRLYPWTSSHLRTFYAWLYKRIKKEDIMFEGKFVPVCGDLAIMFPMLEMAGTHSRFIPEVLYIYNCENQYSYWNNRPKEETRKNQCSTRIRCNAKRSKHKFKKSNKIDTSKTDRIHLIIGRHLRQEITPYLPLQESDLHVC